MQGVFLNRVTAAGPDGWARPARYHERLVALVDDLGAARMLRDYYAEQNHDNLGIWFDVDSARPDLSVEDLRHVLGIHSA
jgi:hypothetical protein